MTNIFDCSSTENYLCEILEYSLNVEKVSIDNLANDIWLASTFFLDRECHIKIIFPSEADSQAGYKIVCNAIDSLTNQGIDNIASDNFMRLKVVYKSLISRLLLVCEPPLIGWFSLMKVIEWQYCTD